MSVATSAESIGKAVRLIRVLLIANFVLFLILLGPGMSHKFDLALRRAGIEDLVGRLTQIWVVGSTSIASALCLEKVEDTRIEGGASANCTGGDASSGMVGDCFRMSPLCFCLGRGRLNPIEPDVV